MTDDAPSDETSMTDFDMLGPPISRTTDGSRTTWNLFGNMRIPPVQEGGFAVSPDDKLVYDKFASHAKPSVASRVVQQVGDEEIAEIAMGGTLVMLPPDTSSVTVAMDSAMRSRYLLVRRRRQQQETESHVEATVEEGAASAAPPRQGIIAVRVLVALVLILMAVLLSLRNI